MGSKHDFTSLLLGKDLRSISRANEVASMVVDQETFDELFLLLFHHERTLVMRAADAIEKATRKYPEFLQPHKQQLMRLFKGAMSIELKWHVVQLIPRIRLSSSELNSVVSTIAYWAKNPYESRIVRVNSIQALHDLSQRFPQVMSVFAEVIRHLEHEQTPSIQARIKKLGRLVSNA